MHTHTHTHTHTCRYKVLYMIAVITDWCVFNWDLKQASEGVFLRLAGREFQTLRAKKINELEANCTCSWFSCVQILGNRLHGGGVPLLRLWGRGVGWRGCGACQGAHVAANPVQQTDTGTEVGAGGSAVIHIHIFLCCALVQLWLMWICVVVLMFAKEGGEIKQQQKCRDKK